MIDFSSFALYIGGFAGVWAAGYVAGWSAAWVRRLKDAA